MLGQLRSYAGWGLVASANDQTLMELLCLKSLLVAWRRDNGSAAGCEAGLCPAVRLLKRKWATPLVWPLAQHVRAEPEPGA